MSDWFQFIGGSGLAVLLLIGGLVIVACRKASHDDDFFDSP
jgi:hypothetical protein